MLNFVPLLLVGLAVLPIAGVVVWAWLALDRTEDELRSFVGFDGMHFED
jgi:hypothetical protein